MVFKIVSSLERRLLSSLATTGDNSYPEIGVLSGVTFGQNSYLLSASNSTEIIPASLVFLSVFVTSEEKVKDVKSVLGSGHSFNNVLITSESKDSLRLWSVSKDNVLDKEVPLESVTDESFLQSVVEIHLSGCLEKGTDLSDLSFQLKNCKFILKKTDKGSVQDIYGHVQDQESQDLEDTPAPADMKKKMREKLKKKRITEKAPIHFELFSSKQLQDLSLKDRQGVDIIVFVSLAEKNCNLWTALKNAVDQQLSLLSSHPGDEEVELLTFFPRGVTCHPVSLVYPVAKSDDDLIDVRRRIHVNNFLPLDKPLFRRLNKQDASSSGYLINPHEGLDRPAFPVVSIVQGRYAYHHYMQDNFNDNGWGCAYRSLQTIVSWFRLQGYTDKGIPSHKEIQQALVDCGDKSSSFVGSSKWIGSNEVSFVLNQLYGITSRMMFVSAGSEMASKGRELVAHFETQGTPVMIGGGVLAHTIIGMAFDEKKGDTKFLILDPHFTGTEDLTTVQKKGWCGWKASSFWENNSFYNMCLPQKPQGF